MAGNLPTYLKSGRLVMFTCEPAPPRNRSQPASQTTFRIIISRSMTHKLRKGGR
jgi:hypothetical protein